MRRVALPFILSLAACSNIPPSPAPAPRPGTKIQASFGRTWEAALEYLAAASFPVHMIDRPSGFIGTETMPVTWDDGLAWADCGATPLEVPLAADRVIYTVLVRGDSTASEVRVAARWTNGPTGDPEFIECVSRNVNEPRVELSIKRQAEGIPLPSPNTKPTGSTGR